MKKFAWVPTIAMVCGLSACDLLLIGPAAKCGALCSRYEECWPEYYEERMSGYSQSGYSCEWADGLDVKKICQESCEKANSNLNGDGRQVVEACFDCMHSEVNDTCNDEKIVDAFKGACGDQCDDEKAVQTFISQFFAQGRFADLTCE